MIWSDLVRTPQFGTSLKFMKNKYERTNWHRVFYTFLGRKSELRIGEHFLCSVIGLILWIMIIIAWLNIFGSKVENSSFDWIDCYVGPRRTRCDYPLNYQFDRTKSNTFFLSIEYTMQIAEYVATRVTRLLAPLTHTLLSESVSSTHTKPWIFCVVISAVAMVRLRLRARLQMFAFTSNLRRLTKLVDVNPSSHSHATPYQDKHEHNMY